MSSSLSKREPYQSKHIVFCTSILSLFSWISPTISIFLFSSCSYPIPSLFCTQTHECSCAVHMRTICGQLNKLLHTNTWMQLYSTCVQSVANWINCLQQIFRENACQQTYFLLLPPFALLVLFIPFHLDQTFPKYFPKLSAWLGLAQLDLAWYHSYRNMRLTSKLYEASIMLWANGKAMLMKKNFFLTIYLGENVIPILFKSDFSHNINNIQYTLVVTINKARLSFSI